MREGIIMDMISDWTVEQLKDESGRKEFSQQASARIRAKVLKTSIMDQVIPPEPVREDERICGQGDTVLIKKDVRMDGTTMLMDMQGEPTFQNVSGYSIPICIPMGTVSTEVFEKRYDELSAPQAIGKVIEDIASQAHTERDKKFLQYCELAVAETGQEKTSIGPLNKNTFREITHPALFKEIKTGVVLLSEFAFFGSELDDTAPFIADMHCIQSTKSDLFDTFEGDKLVSTDIWSFPAPKSWGYNLYCGDYGVWNDWNLGLWRCKGWEWVGAAFGNINGITKMTVNMG